MPNPSGSQRMSFDAASAAQALDAIRSELASGKPFHAVLAPWLAKTQREQMLLSRAEHWLEHWQARVDAGELSPSYYRELDRYVHHPGYWAKYLSGRLVTEITPAVIDDMNLWLATHGGASGTGIGPASRNKVLGALRVLMRWLRRRREISADDVPEIPTVEVPEYSPRILESRQQTRVLERIPYDRRGAFLACRLGVRPSEARASHVSDYTVSADGQAWLTIDKACKGPNSNAPILHTKAWKARAIPIDTALRDWIKWRLQKRAAAMRDCDRSPMLSPAMFPNPRARTEEKRWTLSSMEHEWNRVRRLEGTDAALYEGTKHSFATAARERGIPLDQIQKFLGHADAKSTERYGRLRNSALVRILPSN